jgi:RND family efflux transporter MFP subunit
MRPILAFCAICTISCTGPYSGQKVSAKESKPALKVKVERAVTSAIPEIITANGELFAEEMATVSAKVPGRVSKLLVDLGTIVKPGEVLAELEKDDYEFRVKQSEALVEQIRARLGLTPRQSDDKVVPEETAIVREAAAAVKEANFIFDTTTRLQKDGVVSRIDFEKAQVRAQGALAKYQGAIEEVMQLRAQLSERRAQLALARQQLTDCTIRAPFAGSITRRIANLGEYLATNSGVVSLVRQHPLRIRLEVPERQAAKVRSGQRIDIRLEGSAVRTGHVVRLSPAIDAQNRSLLVEGEIPNQDGVLRPGSFTEGTITINPNARGIAIPLNALLSFAGIERVYIVTDGALDDRLVKTGRRFSDERVEVLEGLREGDQVILKVHDRMVKGEKVAVN